jgi:hypothetical protein
VPIYRTGNSLYCLQTLGWTDGAWGGITNTANWRTGRSFTYEIWSPAVDSSVPIYGAQETPPDEPPPPDPDVIQLLVVLELAPAEDVEVIYGALEEPAAELAEDAVQWLVVLEEAAPAAVEVLYGASAALEAPPGIEHPCLYAGSPGCEETVLITVIADPDVDLEATIRVLGLACPTHLTAQRSQLIASRPPEEQGTPWARTLSGPCELCGGEVAATAYIPEGVTGVVASSQGRRHTSCG